MGNCLITRKGSNVKLEGNATQEDVLLNKTFYANDKNIKSGTMNNNGAISANVAINGEYTIPKGYHDGNGKVIGPKIIHNIYTNLSANSEVIDTGRSSNKVSIVIACKIYKNDEGIITSSDGVWIKASNKPDMQTWRNILGDGVNIGYKSEHGMHNEKDKVVNYRYFQVMSVLPAHGNNLISLIFKPNE